MTFKFWRRIWNDKVSCSSSSLLISFVYVIVARDFPLENIHCLLSLLLMFCRVRNLESRDSRVIFFPLFFLFFKNLPTATQSPNSDSIPLYLLQVWHTGCISQLLSCYCYICMPAELWFESMGDWHVQIQSAEVRHCCQQITFWFSEVEADVLFPCTSSSCRLSG